MKKVMLGAYRSVDAGDGSRDGWLRWSNWRKNIRRKRGWKWYDEEEEEHDEEEDDEEEEEGKEEDDDGKKEDMKGQEEQEEEDIIMKQYV